MLVLALVPVLVAPSAAQAATGPAVSARVTGPTTINPMETTTLRATYTKNGNPVPAATLRLQKLIGGSYRDVGTITITNGAGTTTLAPLVMLMVPTSR